MEHNTPTVLVCPKCHGAMRTYERSGVHVDQCADCRGIFLDRGELERLVDAEKGYFDTTFGGRKPSGKRYDDDDDDDYDYRSYKRKKKKSFLSEIFDFD